MQLLKKLGRIYNRIEEWFLLTILGIMVVVVFYAVIRRYVFNNSLVWSDEISRFIFMWLIWFAASIGFRDNNHIRMNVIYNVLKARGKLVLDIISDLFVFAASILVAYQGYMYCLRMHGNGLIAPATGLPYWFVYGCLPVSMTIILIRLVPITYNHIKSLYRLLRFGEEVQVGHVEESDVLAESWEKAEHPGKQAAPAAPDTPQHQPEDSV